MKGIWMSQMGMWGFRVLSYVLTPKLLVLTGQELRQASRVLSTELCDQIPPTHRKEVSLPVVR